jgi:hypothetical protein
MDKDRIKAMFSYPGTMHHEPARRRYLWAQDRKRQAMEFLRGHGWDITPTTELGGIGKRYNAVLRSSGGVRTVVIQVRDGGRTDILSEIYAPYYGPTNARNRPGRDLGDYDLKVVAAGRLVFVIEGAPHRSLLKALVDLGRWDKLKVVSDARTGQTKLLAFTGPADYPEGALQQLVMPAAVR